MQTSEEKTAGSRGKGTKKILVVDDEEIIRDLVDDILSEQGYKVFLAGDGREGLELFNKYDGQFDLIILDIIMPEIDGPEFFYAIRKKKPDAKILLTSGYSKSKVKDEMLKNGIRAYLPKPFNMVIFLNTINEILNE